MLTTLANVKTYLSITDNSSDTLLTLLLTRADSYIKKYVDRKIESGSIDLVETKNGDGRNQLLLKEFPIISITKIEYNSGTLSTPVWTQFSADDFTFDPRSGIVYFSTYIPTGIQNIKATYKGGFAADDIPLELSIACEKLTAWYFNKRSSDGITHESVDGASITYDKTTASDIPSEISVILDEYKTYYV